MISIAMATYNGSCYLREQIDSILSQTIQDFELVICDDCSTDNTMPLLKSYSEKDSRIHVYQNEHNLGFKENFSRAISLCNGDYVALSDQDDIWMNNHLEILLRALNDQGVALACGDAIIIDSMGNEKGITSSYIDGMNVVPQTSIEIARHILLCENTFQGSSMLMRKTLAERSLPIPSTIGFHDTWIAALACFTGGLTYVHTPVLKYRRHSFEVTKGKRRMSPLRKFVGVSLFNHSLKDRKAIVGSILHRANCLTDSEIHELQLIESMLSRRTTLWGRLLNIPYYLKHFKTIYTTNGLF